MIEFLHKMYWPNADISLTFLLPVTTPAPATTMAVTTVPTTAGIILFLNRCITVLISLKLLSLIPSGDNININVDTELIAHGKE